jgi:hypothetical protein
MNKKIIGIIFSMLMVTSSVIIVTGEFNSNKEKKVIKNLENYYSNDFELLIESSGLSTWNEHFQISIEITKPEKALYLNNNKVFPLILTTIIIGSITVETEVSGSQAEKVEFYIDDVLEYTDYSEPFNWIWDEQISMKHTIKVKAYDQNKTSVEKSINVWIFNGEADISPPKVWLTSPLPTDLLYEPTWDVAVVSEDIVSLSAAKIGGSEEISHTIFEYSSDGYEWTQINIDTNGGFEGIIFDNDEDHWYGGNKKMGEEGWNSVLDISSFPEMDYFLRATMTDITGRSGSCIRKIHLDRTPPKPIIQNPSFGARVSGIVEFIASSNANNVVSMEVKLFHGSPGWFNQSGLGNARQNPGDGGICAPTATANGLAGLGENKIYPPGEAGNDTAVQQELIDDMNTDKKNGTNCWKPTGGANNENETDQMGDAIKKYLEERGIGCSNDSGYDVKVYKVKIDKKNGEWGIVPGSNEITFEEYSKQIRLKQAVILAFADFHINHSKELNVYSNGYRLELPNGTESHAVTGRGTNSEENDEGYNEVSIQDTNGENKTCSWTNFSDGGGGNISVMQYGRRFRAIIGMWVICPKNKDAKVSNIGIDNNPQDGFMIAYDTNGVEDGTHVFIVDMVDSDGFIGSDAIILEIDNTYEDNENPYIKIQTPQNNQQVSNPIYIGGYADDGPDGSGITLIDYNLQWNGGNYDGPDHPIDPPQQYIDFLFGPIDLSNYIQPGDLITITVFATDDAGNTGFDTVTVTWVEDEDNTPPVTKKTIGEPNEDGGYIIWPFTPITFEATDDMSGVQYIYYEVWWDSDEDGIVDMLMAEKTVYDNIVMFSVDMYGILINTIELRWYAVDNADNIEDMHYQQHYVTP